mmetsp:Transcript_2401/g.2671  ORF Transcript_2401/g.2671 Transcript_2401/m.2671 type:complete len:496 (-) Transcript_2401:392-1879(-)
METTDWSNAVYSPGAKGETSPYFHDLEHDTAGGHGGQQQTANQATPNFTEQDQYLLNQIEHNLYEAASNGTPGSVNGNHINGAQNTRADGSSGKYEFGLDNLNFVLPEDISYEQQSTAYPPSASSLNNNTPHMLATNVKKLIKPMENPSMFMSPVLPSQNDKSYNNQHLYHKYQKNSEDGQAYAHQPQNQHIRPDAVFTPLESPTATPRDQQVNSNNYPYNPPVQASFEPLTSPALAAQQADKRRSSSVYAPTEDGAPHKRKTPHGTPILHANGPRSKRSPSVKPRSSHKSLTSSPFEKLPEAGVDLQRNSSESTPMLPPLGKKVDIPNNSVSSEAPSSATMMGFTMSVLAEQQQEGSNRNSSLEMAHDTPLNGQSRNGSLSYKINHKIPNKSSSSSETSPMMGLQGSGESSPALTKTKSRSEKPTAKKASHKLAEQGRRNRMNMAVQELSNLIPQAYHDEVSIPSKATTIELASKYIRDLIKENNEMKYYNLQR